MKIAILYSAQTPHTHEKERRDTLFSTTTKLLVEDNHDNLVMRKFLCDVEDWAIMVRNFRTANGSCFGVTYVHV